MHINLRRRQLLYSVLLIPALLSPAILCHITLAAAWGYFFLMFFCTLLFLALILSPTTVKTPPLGHTTTLASSSLSANGDLSASYNLPVVPRTMAEVYRAIDDETFEFFSIALIIAKRSGHEFIEYIGKSGDRGAIARLRNLYGQLVIVQSKHYASDHDVSPSAIREFAGAITHQGAAYGYFVTTSGFGLEAQRAIDHDWRIRAIDGKHIEEFLRYRSRDIQQAYHEILIATQHI